MQIYEQTHLHVHKLTHKHTQCKNTHALALKNPQKHACTHMHSTHTNKYTTPFQSNHHIIVFIELLEYTVCIDWVNVLMKVMHKDSSLKLGLIKRERTQQYSEHTHTHAHTHTLYSMVWFAAFLISQLLCWFTVGSVFLQQSFRGQTFNANAQIHYSDFSTLQEVCRVNKEHGQVNKRQKF